MSLRDELPISEAEWLSQVLDWAERRHWMRAHFRVARTQHGWRTPVQADGAGFPDLILVRPPRAIAAELKSERGRLTRAQANWLELLGEAGLETYVWRPGDLQAMAETLR